MALETTTGGKDLGGLGLGHTRINHYLRGEHDYTEAFDASV